MLTIGIDIGGTSCGFVALAADGRMAATTTLIIGPDRDEAGLLELLHRGLADIGGAGAPAGIGIGVPATLLAGRPIDPAYCNFPGLAKLDLSALLSSQFDCGCWMENDAKAALRGEWRHGAAVGADNVALLTLGTGIGSAFVLDGHIRDGAHGNHGEVGLTLVGGPGCWTRLEDIAAPGALRRRGGPDLPEMLAQADSGSQAAAAMVGDMIDRLGATVASIHLMLDLDMVVLAGGMTAMGPRLVEGVDAAFRRHCPALYQLDLKIRLGRFRELAGAVGAATLARERLLEDAPR